MGGYGETSRFSRVAAKVIYKQFTGEVFRKFGFKLDCPAFETAVIMAPSGGNRNATDTYMIAFWDTPPCNIVTS
jgi:hypothetical protein